MSDWTSTAVGEVRESPDRVLRLFPVAARSVPRDVPGAAEDARADLVCVLVEEHGAAGAELLTRLYRQGDDGEKRGVLHGLDRAVERGVGLGDDVVTAGREVLADALRTNDTRLVSAAMGRFGAAHLDQHAWRHGVLKLVFMGVPLEVVHDLGSRADDELAEMAERFAAERRAAGREVPPDLTLILSRPA